MRMGVRLSLWLIAGITCVSLLFAVYQVEVEYQGRRHELQRRAELLGESLQETVERLRGDGATAEMQRLVDRFDNRGHVEGIAFYDEHAAPIAMTKNLSGKLEPHLGAVEQAVLVGKET